MQKNIELAKKSLELIRDIADRGASFCNSEVIGYALQELSQVLLERTGVQDQVFEPVRADEIRGLDALLTELEWVDCASREFTRPQKCN